MELGAPHGGRGAAEAGVAGGAAARAAGGVAHRAAGDAEGVLDVNDEVERALASTEVVADPPRRRRRKAGNDPTLAEAPAEDLDVLVQVDQEEPAVHPFLRGEVDEREMDRARLRRLAADSAACFMR